ncbi:M15 family metallopeptidase [Dehalobacter sp. DCM]|uniref:M15 family metallopeptidase n=1 Tax=Dehalobacter sp. DCM TaxID=2907827 RepID=UPI003081B5E1|nr:M15 family metallopeptidase [Dehalobacter sp. DCM]
MKLKRKILPLHRKRILFILTFILLTATLVVRDIYLKPEVTTSQLFDQPNPDTPAYEAVMKRDILCLMLAYPSYITGIEKTDNNQVYLVMKSGRKILYDDEKEKNTWQISDNPDLQDMMQQIYPLGNISTLMLSHNNPGCLRVYPLLKEVYGVNKKTILANLVKVSIGYKYVEFNQNNNASMALASVMKELLPLSRQSNKIYAASFPCSGAYNYRLIGGTGRLSSHAYGIAIDLNNNKYDYWRWSTREEGQKRLDAYPQEIPQIFEKYGFIWGGKWGNFDIMHYEYRPEIILKARYFSEDPISGIPWYAGLQNDKEAWQYIWQIENSLK